MKEHSRAILVVNTWVCVYILKNHQVAHLRFFQIMFSKLYLYIKSKNNEISTDLPKLLKLKRN